jgi:hypothetical protein
VKGITSQLQELLDHQLWYDQGHGH